jgi:hypothetical protein
MGQRTTQCPAQPCLPARAQVPRPCHPPSLNAGPTPLPPTLAKCRSHAPATHRIEAHDGREQAQVRLREPAGGSAERHTRGCRPPVDWGCSVNAQPRQGGPAAPSRPPAHLWPTRKRCRASSPLPPPCPPVAHQEALPGQQPLHLVHGAPQVSLHAVVGRLAGGEARLVDAVLDGAVQLRGREGKTQGGRLIGGPPDRMLTAWLWCVGRPAVSLDAVVMLQPSRPGLLPAGCWAGGQHMGSPPLFTPPPRPSPLLRPLPRRLLRTAAPPPTRSFMASIAAVSCGGHRSTPLLPGGFMSLSMRTMSGEELATMRRVCARGAAGHGGSAGGLQQPGLAQQCTAGGRPGEAEPSHAARPHPPPPTFLSMSMGAVHLPL